MIPGRVHTAPICGGQGLLGSLEAGQNLYATEVTGKGMHSESPRCTIVAPVQPINDGKVKRESPKP